MDTKQKDNVLNRENEVEEVNEWRNEHGEPNLDYIASLASDGDPKALEELKSIALGLDVDFDSNTSTADLIDRIRVATKKSENGNLNDTN
jgi:hypothetical protein